jgi:S1-C subfamily serine protease
MILCSSSAVIIDWNRGLLLTNSHCIEKVTSIVKVLIDKSWYQAQVLAKAFDQDTIDVCLLQIRDWKPKSKKDPIKYSESR